MTEVVPQEVAQFTDGALRVNTQEAESLTFLLYHFDAQESPLTHLK